MRSANEKKMFELLLDEIEDTLQDIEQRCLKLESSDQTKELQVIFRAAHNVKGASQLYGLTEFGGFVHAFEDLLTTLQKIDKPVTSVTVDLMLFAQNFLREWVLNLRSDDKYVPDASAIKTQLKTHVEDLRAGRVVADAGTSSPAPAPAAQAPTVSAPLPQAAAPMETHAAEPVPASPAPAAPSESDNASNHRKLKRSTTLRIPSAKIDDIIQFIGELSINQGILWHNYQNNTFNILNCKNAVTLNQKTLKELYDLILTLRMQPADSLFQRIEKTARDIAREQKKKIQVQLTGADIPLDKTVIELITDPMMHLVRNAVDHGIEDEESRQKIGKNPVAKLSISTQQDSGNVIISISDDGRGMDPQVIWEKAVKKDLVDSSKKMKEDEIIQLIFLPGFSTRDQVTEISGRGVGMDIVQKAIQQLGGRIDTFSKKGAGTTFQITLPASLEIIDGLLIRVSDTIYIMPRQDVEEIVDLNAFVVETVGRGGRAIRMRDSVVPVEDLSDYIGNKARPKSEKAEQEKHDSQYLPSLGMQTDTANDTALIIRMPDRTRLALRVDTVMAQQQIVVRPLSEQLASVPGFTGVTILGNGEPAMIVSANYIGNCYLKWVTRSGRAA